MCMLLIWKLKNQGAGDLVLDGWRYVCGKVRLAEIAKDCLLFREVVVVW